MHPGYPQHGAPGGQGVPERTGTGFAPPPTPAGQPGPSQMQPQGPGQQGFYGGWQTTAGPSGSAQRMMYPPQGYPQQRGLTRGQQQVIWRHQSEIEQQRRLERIQMEKASKQKRHEEFRRQHAMPNQEKAVQKGQGDAAMAMEQPGPSRSAQLQQPGSSMAQYQSGVPSSSSYQPGVPSSSYSQQQGYSLAQQQQLIRQQQAQRLQMDPRMLQQRQLLQQQGFQTQVSPTFQQPSSEPMDQQQPYPQAPADPSRMTLQEHALMMQRQRQLQLQQQAYHQQQQRAYQQHLQQQQMGATSSQAGYPQGSQASVPTSSRDAYPNQTARGPNGYPYQQQQQDPQSSSINNMAYQQQPMYEAHKRQELARQQQQQQAQIQQQQSNLQTQSNQQQQYQRRQADTPGSSYSQDATPSASSSIRSIMSSSSNGTPRPPASSSAVSRRTDVTDVVEGELDQFEDILFMTDFGEKPLPPVNQNGPKSANGQQTASNSTHSTTDEISNALAAIHSSDDMLRFSNLVQSDSSTTRPIENLEDFLHTCPLRPTAIFGARPNPWRPAGPELDVEIPEPFPEDKDASLALLKKMLDATVIKPTEFDIQSACNITMQPPENPENWCHVHYYEFSEHHGDSFRVYEDELIIDGQCAPSTPGRLCIGNIGNPNRDPVAVAARRQIGRGCRITRNMQGLAVESLSDAAIFIQAPIHAESRGDHSNTIYRLSKGQSMRLFDYEFFNQVLQNAVMTNDFDTVYKVQLMCHIRMSFVKGWGGCYRREQIHYTPCWIEIHLSFPLQCVDRCLFTMKQTPPSDVHQE
uniref:MH2 domain-containing protein n=1 Tax=Panagrellus redivivus TaxID=6233 RepID=A0A7E4VUI6_PANRE